MPRPGPVFDPVDDVLGHEAARRRRSGRAAVRRRDRGRCRASERGARGVDEKLTCTWSVVRLADLDAAPLLTRPTTAALAALAHGTPAERRAALARAVEIISRSTTADRRKILLGAATTLASIVLPRVAIDAALKEAMMPVPVRETPLGMELLEKGREEGRRELLADARALLLHRFGADPRIDVVASRLVVLAADDRISQILSATALDDLID